MGGCVTGKSERKKDEAAQLPKTLTRSLESATKQIQDIDQDFDEKNLEVIKNCQNLTLPLWVQNVGVLTWYDCQKNKHVGSGFLIADNLVLTTASNIYNKKYDRQNFQMYFYLAQDETTTNRVLHRVQTWLYKPEYLKQCHSDRNSLNDYAILKLEYNRQAPIHLKEHLALSVPCLDCMSSRKELSVEMCKITQDENAQKECPKKVIDSGRATNLSHKGVMIRYDIKTDQKDVGCPVVSNEKIIAIHHRSDGIGRLTTSDMVDTINSFCKKLGENFVKVSKNELCTCKKKVEEEIIKKDLQNYLLQCRQKSIKQIPKQIQQRSSQIIKLKAIDLTSHDNQKLTPKSIQVFSQLKLVNLQELKLDNNRIADEGVKLLSNNPYPNLKVFSIDDNGVSINGLKFIYFNKWGEEVEYKLASVQTNDDGYYLKVDQNIPLIKSLINQKDMSQNKVINRLDEKTVQNALKLFLLTPLQGEDPQKMATQSKELEEIYKKSIKEKAPTISTLLLHLKKCLGDSLQFSKQASLKTNVTSKIIFNGSSNERVSFQVDLSNFKDIRPEQLKDNSSLLRQLEPIFLRNVSTMYGADTADITLDKILNNPPRAIASDSLSQVLGTNLVPYKKMNPKFKQHFEKFRLCESEFDSAGDYQFPAVSKAQNQVRGGFPYYQPVIGKRFGIRVLNIFKDNTWISMDNRKGEYAVGFHGINNPLTTSALQNIMKGREKGEMLRAGSGQNYEKYDCINKNQKVGSGIYFSPYFLTSLLGYSNISQGQDYHIVLQCRLKPDSIKITHQTDYWVVNKSEDARPYGILLFTRDQVTELSNLVSSKDPVVLHKDIYKDQFTAQTWKNKYLPIYQEFKRK